MKKLKTSGWVLIGVFTLLTAASWISFEVYRGFTQTTVPTGTNRLLIPIEPRFDEDTLTNLQGRIKFSPEELTNIVVKTPLTTVTVTPTPALEASAAAEASPSATL